VILAFAIGCGNNPDKAYERAMRAYQQNDWIGASLYAQEFVDRFPDDPRVRQMYDVLVNCHMNLKEWALARSVCEEVVKRFPNENVRYGAELARGATFLGEGKFDEGLAAFSQIIDSTAGIVVRLRAIDYTASAYQMKASQPNAATETELANAISAYDRWLALASIPEAASAISDITQACAGILTRRAEVWHQAGDLLRCSLAYAEIADATQFPDLTRSEWSYYSAEYLKAHIQKGNPDAPISDADRQQLIAAYTKTVEQFPDTDFGIWARVELCKLYKPIDPQKAESYLAQAVERYQKYVEQFKDTTDPHEKDMQRFYKTKIADAYFAVEDLDRAEKAFLDLRKTFADDQNVVQYCNMKLKFIEDIRNRVSGSPVGATAELEAATPAGQ